MGNIKTMMCKSGSDKLDMWILGCYTEPNALLAHYKYALVSFA